MGLPHLFSFKTVVYENNVCSKRDGKSKQFAILIFLVQKFYLIKLRLPISVGVNICFKFPVSSTLPPHIIYSLENSDNIFLHFLTYSTPCCCPNNHLVSIRLDFSLSALAGNEDRRKGWLQLTLPICTLNPPTPLPLSIQNIFSEWLGWISDSGWLNVKAGIYLVWNSGTKVVFWIVHDGKKRAFTWSNSG